MVLLFPPPPLFSIGLGCVIGWRLWHLHTCETGLQWREGGVDDLSFFFSRYSIHNSDRLHRHPEPINRLTEKKKSTSNKRNEKKKKIKLNQINKYKNKKKKKNKQQFSKFCCCCCCALVLVGRFFFKFISFLLFEIDFPSSVKEIGKQF